MKKDLADKVDEFTVRLKFESKKDRTSADKFYQTSKKNECVVCGAKDGLIKYYIVPQCYRKHFPIEIKSHSSHDIVLLCHDCHQMSQQKEGILRQRLCKLYGIADLNKRLNLDKNLVNISKGAKTYIHNKDTLPIKRKNEIFDMIQGHFQLETHEDINDEILNKAMKLVPNKEEMNELKQMMDENENKNESKDKKKKIFYGQIIVGPPGSGKTTYCHAI